MPYLVQRWPKLIDLNASQDLSITIIYEYLNESNLTKSMKMKIMSFKQT